MSGVLTSLLLDLDGTLIDSKPGIMDSYGTAVKLVFPHQNYDETQVVIGPPLPQMFQATFPKATPNLIENLVAAFRNHYAREGLFKTVLFDGVAETLVRCRGQGIELFIATNKPLRLTGSILDHLKIASHFRCVLATDSSQPPFSNKAAMIGHLINQHGCKPRESVYVGDTAEDATAAAIAGVPFIWAAYGYGNLTADQVLKPFASIQHFGELETILALAPREI